ncbi:MAG: N-acetyltransferase [Nitrospirae bacterium]|nr:MAG: N-acetyltransferase [Nitrospirota bacterium]
MNLFRRWTGASMMRLLWPSLKSMYSKDFVKFAEYQLNLSGIKPVVSEEPKTPQSLSLPLSDLFEWRDVEAVAKRQDVPPPFKSLFRELGYEWPHVPHEDLAPYFKPFSGSQDVWTVSHPDSEAEMWGIAMVASHPSDATLKRLMVWVRPAYRGVGLGLKLLEAVLEAVLRVEDSETKTDTGKQKDVNEKKKGLVVVLPPLRRDKPGYADEMAGWLRFYGRKGFVRTTQKDAERILSTPFDPAAFCLVMPELLEQAHKPAVQGGASSP